MLGSQSFIVMHSPNVSHFDTFISHHRLHQLTIKHFRDALACPRSHFVIRSRILLHSKTSLTGGKTGSHGWLYETYACLAEHCIPDRVSVLPLTRWRANIFSLMTKIPNIKNKGIYFAIVCPGVSDIEITEYFLAFILLTLRRCEDLLVCALLLEMAMWKHHIMLYPLRNRTSLLDPLFRKQCRLDSLSMVALIMPLVFSFLELDSVNPK